MVIKDTMDSVFPVFMKAESVCGGSLDAFFTEQANAFGIKR